MLKGTARLLVTAGSAKPSPKIGQALGPLGVNMMEFCKKFNDQTSSFNDDAIMRVKLRAFDDRTFDFQVFPPPTTWFLKRCAGVGKGAHRPKHEIIGKVNLKQIYEISALKKKLDPSLQLVSLKSICSSVISTAYSMGLEVVKTEVEQFGTDPIPAPPATEASNA